MLDKQDKTLSVASEEVSPLLNTIDSHQNSSLRNNKNSAIVECQNKSSRAFSVQRVANIESKPTFNQSANKNKLENIISNDEIIDSLSCDVKCKNGHSEIADGNLLGVVKDLPSPRKLSAVHELEDLFTKGDPNSDNVKESNPITEFQTLNDLKNPIILDNGRNNVSKPILHRSKSVHQSWKIPLSPNRRNSYQNKFFPHNFINSSNQAQVLPAHHYLTISNGEDSSTSSPLEDPVYFTLQPFENKAYKTRLETLMKETPFLSKIRENVTAIDYGSTDGRNVKLLSRRIYSMEEPIRSDEVSDKSIPSSNDPESPSIVPGSPSSDMPSLSLTLDSATKIVDYPSPSSEEGGDSLPLDRREQWGNKLKFILACIGSCVGLGNLWRFPYLAYKSGGGAFLIPYCIMLFLCGIPLLLMEMAIGQYTRRGPVGALGKICPFFIGSAIGVVVISTIFCSYYNIIISWSLFYLSQSFRSALPWVTCSGNDSSVLCMPNDTMSPTEYYFNNYVLQKSEGFYDFGTPVPSLLGIDVIAWVFVYFAIWKSVKSSGNMVLFTATVPFVFIAVFLYQTVTLDGAGDGLTFFFSPKWHLLLDPKVWVNAASQNFNSIGIGFGAMITFSSYNKFNNNLLADVWTISLVNACTSLIAGMIVFSTLGNIALETGKNITDVVAEGPGLVFVVYPQALAKMSYPNVMSFCFFSLLFMLGIDSQFATVEVIVTSIKDSFPNLVTKYLKRHEVLAAVVCVICFLLGLPNICNGGIYYFSILDHYSAAISLMFLAFFEVVGVVWIYGTEQLSKDIRHMTGRFPSAYFKICWKFVSPVLIIVLCFFSWYSYTSPTYGGDDFTFPTWSIIFGWCVALSSILPIPVAGMVVIFRAPGDSFKEKLKNSLRTTLPQYCKDCYPEHCKCEKHVMEKYQYADLEMNTHL